MLLLVPLLLLLFPAAAATADAPAASAAHGTALAVKPVETALWAATGAAAVGTTVASADATALFLLELCFKYTLS